MIIQHKCLSSQLVRLLYEDVKKAGVRDLDCREDIPVPPNTFGIMWLWWCWL